MPHLIVASQHYDAGLQIFDNFLVECRQSGDVTLALSDQMFAATDFQG
jgi:hypothetical protein